MSKTTILCAAALLVLFGCKQSENVNTSSSETTSTVSTTAPATAPVTDTSSTTMTAGTTTETAAPTQTATTTSPATATSSGAMKRETKKTTGPVVTETVSPSGAVSLPKNPPPPPKATEPEKGTTTTESKSSTAPASSSNAGLASTGQGIFKAQCTACHGADASGNTPIGKKNNIPDFRSTSVQGLSDAELANVIANGKGPISSSAHKSKHLSSDQISAVIAYIRSLK